MDTCFNRAFDLEALPIDILRIKIVGTRREEENSKEKSEGFRKRQKIRRRDICASRRGELFSLSSRVPHRRTCRRGTTKCTRRRPRCPRRS